MAYKTDTIPCYPTSNPASSGEVWKLGGARKICYWLLKPTPHYYMHMEHTKRHIERKAIGYWTRDNHLIIKVAETPRKKYSHFTTNDNNIYFFGHETRSINGMIILNNRQLSKLVLGFRLRVCSITNLKLLFRILRWIYQQLLERERSHRSLRSLLENLFWKRK